jgi:hypothetical protein
MNEFFEKIQRLREPENEKSKNLQSLVVLFLVAGIFHGFIRHPHSPFATVKTLGEFSEFVVRERRLQSHTSHWCLK